MRSGTNDSGCCGPSNPSATKMFSMWTLFFIIGAVIPSLASKETVSLQDQPSSEKDLIFQILKRLVKSDDFDYVKDVEEKAPQCGVSTHERRIIKKVDSLNNGAKFLTLFKSIQSNGDCSDLCCENTSCDLAVYENKGDHYCYLFLCDGKCKFGNHSSYVYNEISHHQSSSEPLTADDDSHELSQSYQDFAADTEEGDDIRKTEDYTTTTTTLAVMTSTTARFTPATSTNKTTVAVAAAGAQIQPHSAGLGETCERDLHCQDLNAECNFHQCHCQQGYYNKNHVCREVCPPSNFECLTMDNSGSGVHCVPQAQVCDSISQCADGSDEYRCPGSGDSAGKSSRTQGHLQPERIAAQQRRPVPQLQLQQTQSLQQKASSFDSGSEHPHIEQGIYSSGSSQIRYKSTVGSSQDIPEHLQIADGQLRLPQGFSYQSLPQYSFKPQTHPKSTWSPTPSMQSQQYVFSPNTKHNSIDIEHAEKDSVTFPKKSGLPTWPPDQVNPEHQLLDTQQMFPDLGLTKGSSPHQTRDSQDPVSHPQQMSSLSGPYYSGLDTGSESSHDALGASPLHKDSQQISTDLDSQQSVQHPHIHWHIVQPAPPQQSQHPREQKSYQQSNPNVVGSVKPSQPYTSESMIRKAVSDKNEEDSGRVDSLFTQPQESSRQLATLKRNFSQPTSPQQNRTLIGLPVVQSVQTGTSTEAESPMEPDSEVLQPANTSTSLMGSHNTPMLTGNNKMQIDLESEPHPSQAVGTPERPHPYSAYDVRIGDSSAGDSSTGINSMKNSAGNSRLLDVQISTLQPPVFQPTKISSQGAVSAPGGLSNQYLSPQTYGQQFNSYGSYPAGNSQGYVNLGNSYQLYPEDQDQRIYPEQGYVEFGNPPPQYEFGDFDPNYVEKDKNPGHATGQRPADDKSDETQGAQDQSKTDASTKKDEQTATEQNKADDENSPKSNAESPSGNTAGPTPTTTVTASPTTAAITTQNGWISLKKVDAANEEINMQGPIIALSVGLAFTVILLIFVACRLCKVRRQLRKGRPLHSHEADYLINGMYL